MAAVEAAAAVVAVEVAVAAEAEAVEAAGVLGSATAWAQSSQLGWKSV